LNLLRFKGKARGAPLRDAIMEFADLSAVQPQKMGGFFGKNAERPAAIRDDFSGLRKLSKPMPDFF
jgi:hypothetical protein